jgi:hypothetical protein
MKLKYILTFICVFLLSVLVHWTWGLELSYPNRELGATITMSLFISMVATGMYAVFQDGNII